MYGETDTKLHSNLMPGSVSNLWMQSRTQSDGPIEIGFLKIQELADLGAYREEQKGEAGKPKRYVLDWTQEIYLSGLSSLDYLQRHGMPVSVRGLSSDLDVSALLQKRILP